MLVTTTKPHNSNQDINHNLDLYSYSQKKLEKTGFKQQQQATSSSKSSRDCLNKLIKYSMSCILEAESRIWKRIDKTIFTLCSLSCASCAGMPNTRNSFFLNMSHKYLLVNIQWSSQCSVQK